MRAPPKIRLMAAVKTLRAMRVKASAHVNNFEVVVQGREVHIRQDLPRRVSTLSTGEVTSRPNWRWFTPKNTPVEHAPVILRCVQGMIRRASKEARP